MEDRVIGNTCLRYAGPRSGASGAVSGEQRRDHLAVNVGEPEVTPLEAVRQLFVVDTQTMKDCRVQIVDMNRILHDVVAEVVGLAVNGAGTDASSSHPDRITSRMVIAAVIGAGEFSLTVDGAAKFASPYLSLIHISQPTRLRRI